MELLDFFFICDQYQIIICKYYKTHGTLHLRCGRERSVRFMNHNIIGILKDIIIAAVNKAVETQLRTSTYSEGRRDTLI